MSVRPALRIDQDAKPSRPAVATQIRGTRSGTDVILRKHRHSGINTAQKRSRSHFARRRRDSIGKQPYGKRAVAIVSNSIG